MKGLKTQAVLSTFKFLIVAIVEAMLRHVFLCQALLTPDPLKVGGNFVKELAIVLWGCHVLCSFGLHDLLAPRPAWNV